MVDVLLTFKREELKEKKRNTKVGTVSFFMTPPFISYVSLKDSSVADVCKILPPIIVAQCY